MLRQELLDLKEDSARHEHHNKAVKEKLQRDKEALGQTKELVERDLESLKGTIQKINQDRLQVERVFSNSIPLVFYHELKNVCFFKETEELSKLLEDSGKEKELLVKEKEEVKKELNDVQRDREELRKSYQELESSLQKALRDKDALSNERERLEKSLTELQKSLDSRRRAEESKVLESSTENAVLASEKEALQTQVRTMGTQIQELGDEMEQLQRAKERLDELNESLKKQLTEKLPPGRELARRAAENERLSRELALTLRERDQSEEAKKKDIASKENEVLEVRMQLQFAEQKIDMYEGHVQHLKDRIDHQEAEMESLARVRLLCHFVVFMEIYLL